MTIEKSVQTASTSKWRDEAGQLPRALLRDASINSQNQLPALGTVTSSKMSSTGAGARPPPFHDRPDTAPAAAPGVHVHAHLGGPRMDGSHGALQSFERIDVNEFDAGGADAAYPEQHSLIPLIYQNAYLSRLDLMTGTFRKGYLPGKKMMSYSRCAQSNLNRGRVERAHARTRRPPKRSDFPLPENPKAVSSAEGVVPGAAAGEPDGGAGGRRRAQEQQAKAMSEEAPPPGVMSDHKMDSLLSTLIREEQELAERSMSLPMHGAGPSEWTVKKLMKVRDKQKSRHTRSLLDLKQELRYRELRKVRWREKEAEGRNRDSMAHFRISKKLGPRWNSVFDDGSAAVEERLRGGPKSPKKVLDIAAVLPGVQEILDAGFYYDDIYSAYHSAYSSQDEGTVGSKGASSKDESTAPP
eukprot:CAMPEP_0118856760 /NCGR_PEP_ID=MMETSP1163-20130328/4119_1 /TAXON_ID=124430 /ORGANISM="Phaeomonas parva, Strain CCMP2877" /LENGTH=411 /DNA_ID=CAMNT_0006789935 /DNA_START=244 /DNA_END=1475 /DNA_ORIENTATION=-